MQFVLTRVALVTIVILIILYINDKNNEKHIYNNLRTVSIGDDVDLSIKKMERCMIYLGHTTKPCHECANDSILEIVFNCKGSRLEYYDYPRIIYDSRTNKVIAINNGLAPP